MGYGHGHCRSGEKVIVLYVLRVDLRMRYVLRVDLRMKNFH